MYFAGACSAGARGGAAASMVPFDRDSQAAIIRCWPQIPVH